MHAGHVLERLDLPDTLRDRGRRALALLDLMYIYRSNEGYKRTNDALALREDGTWLLAAPGFAGIVAGAG